jgi:NhaP-type Na+/H+ or K+/H+ antiporter
MILFAIFITLVFLYGLVSRRLEQSVLTAPIVFMAGGALTSLAPGAVHAMAVDRNALLLIAEVGLVMLLFTDAARISPRLLRANRQLPIRLLSVGMLLTILLGAASAMVIYDKLTWWEAGILAAILAPTDAGLGQVIVDSERVPLRIRQALNVEAGLNDGLSVPFLMFFIALAVAQESGAGPTDVLGQFLREQLGYGTLIGIAIGGAGGFLLGAAKRGGWMAASLIQLAVVAIPLLCALASEATHASMFIAAYVAGLAVQFGFREAGQHSVEFTHEWGQLFNFFVFFLFGLMVARELDHFTPAIILYALVSLTLVRMLPVAIALWGSGLSRATVLFMGWFGPRGLASIVLGLIFLEREVSLPGEPTIRLTVMATVLLSILAHGLSAQPGIALYARKVAGLGPGAPEVGAGSAVAAAGEAPIR